MDTVTHPAHARPAIETDRAMMRLLLLLIMFCCLEGIKAQDSFCACESCVREDNAATDCESWGLDCSCFNGCGCEACVRQVPVSSLVACRYSVESITPPVYEWLFINTKLGA